MTENAHRNALQPDYELHWYRIKSVLGQGAFGITYLAHDINLDRSVAIKEYMPNQLAMRDSDQSIQPLSAEQQDDFKWGLQRFITEARTLTKFEHANLVRVFNVFEANNSAYMVMNYELGESLQQILKIKKTLNEAESIRILLPLMSGLEEMHAKGFIHRDIKPGNIFIREDGNPVLLDFGSARQTRGRDAPQTLTSFITPGYAPIEQYTSKSDRQGPWTDIYGLGATLYRVITGKMPDSAIDRGEKIAQSIKDDFIEASRLVHGLYSDEFLAAIDHALAFNARDRPQSIAEWRNEFVIKQEDIKTMQAPMVKADTVDVATVKLEQTYKTTVKLSDDSDEINIAETTADKTATQPPAADPLSPSEKFILILARHKIATVGFATVAIIVFLISILFDNEEIDPVTIEQTTVLAQTQQQQPVATKPLTEVIQKTEPDKTERIEQLLTLATADIKALRLTRPEGNNAYEKYQAILTLDKYNEHADRGIQAIADKYVQLANRAIESNEFEKAENYLGNASRLSPDSKNILTTREILQAKLDKPASEDSPANFMHDVKEWFQESAKKNKEFEEKKTSSDRVIEALGGR